MKTLRAFVHKLFRRRKADTAGAAGNERSFPVKPVHGFLLTCLIGQKVTLALCHKPSHFSEVLTGVVAISVSLSERSTICKLQGFTNAGLDEVKNSAGMNHALRNLRLVESSCGT